MRKLILLVPLLMPMAVLAQLNKCVDAAGKVTFSDRVCDGSAKSGQAINIPLSTEQSPDQRQVAAEEGRERASADRRDAIALMLRDGRIDEARLHAKTAEERAMVNDYAGAKAKPKRSGSTTVCSTSGYAQSGGTFTGTTVCRERSSTRELVDQAANNAQQIRNGQLSTAKKQAEAMRETYRRP